MGLRARIRVKRIMRVRWTAQVTITLGDRTLDSPRFWSKGREQAETLAETWAVRQLSSHESFAVGGTDHIAGDQDDYDYWLDLTRIADEHHAPVDPGPRVEYPSTR